MNIDWAALGSVFGVSLVATVALVGLFTLGVVGLSKQESAAGQGGLGGSRPYRRVRVLRALRGGGGVRDLPDRHLTPHRHHPSPAGPGTPLGCPARLSDVGLSTLSRRRSKAS